MTKPIARTYLFSEPSTSQNPRNFYFREMSLDEMNSSQDLKLMVANTSHRAMENLQKPQNLEKLEKYKKFYPIAQQFREYKAEDRDLPLIKDSNIKPEEMRGFVLEDQSGRPVSIILAGISRDEPLRIMMGTIDTIPEFEGRGYFSIMFDEVVKRVAMQNGNQLPQVLISERGATSLGSNFDTYFHIMRSRSLEMQGVKRVIDQSRSFIPAELEEDKILFRINPKISADKFGEEKRKAEEIALSQPSQAFFMHGIPPREMSLESFAADQTKRLKEKKVYFDPTQQGVTVKSASAESLQKQNPLLRSKL